MIRQSSLFYWLLSSFSSLFLTKLGITMSTQTVEMGTLILKTLILISQWVMLLPIHSSKWKFESTGPNQILSVLFIALNKVKNLLVRTKFYWSWAGGSVLIVITAHIEHVRQYTALKKCLYLTSPCSQNPTRDSLQNFHWTWTFGILNYDIFLKWI